MRTLLISILICTLTSGIYGQDTENSSNTDNSILSAIILSDGSLFYITRKTVKIVTPNGTSVNAGQLTSTDIPQDEKDFLKDYFLNKYENCITYVSEATAKYNCHAYAWYVSEGGIDVWLNSPNQESFWTDGSYDKVDDVTDATKVFYSTTGADHSGTIYSTSSDGTFIVQSKWGCAPMFRHSPSDCEYSSTDLVYFVKCDESVGIHDAISINNPPSGTLQAPGVIIPNNTTIITPCSQASFFAQFTTGGDPVTYPLTFDWSIILYYSGGGKYIYATQTALNQNAMTGCVWQPIPGALPNYNWILDPSGNIMCSINVTVHISDGDTKSTQNIIGVNPNSIYNIQNVTYSTNSTVNACGKLNLTNVSVNNNASVIFNTLGKGIIINSPFNAQLGSTLLINK
jgi:hypothetical protein